jgi:biopolymer transport protein ExbD
MTRSRISFSQALPVDEPTINLTPLIDVVFVILIMFILIAPLLELERVELADGSRAESDSTTSVQESSPLTIHVRHDNTIWYKSQPVSTAQLTEELKLAKIQFPQLTPQVFHDKRAEFGTYQSVKNAIEEAGFSQMEIILKPA